MVDTTKEILITDSPKSDAFTIEDDLSVHTSNNNNNNKSINSEGEVKEKEDMQEVDLGPSKAPVDPIGTFFPSPFLSFSPFLSSLFLISSFSSLFLLSFSSFSSSLYSVSIYPLYPLFFC